MRLMSLLKRCDLNPTELICMEGRRALTRAQWCRHCCRRHRLECAYLLFAALKVCKWYPGIFSKLAFELGELDQVLLDMVPSYHLASAANMLVRGILATIILTYNNCSKDYTCSTDYTCCTPKPLSSWMVI